MSEVCDIGPLGSLEYSAYFGKTQLSTAGGFASYVEDIGLGKVQELGMDYVWNGMLHWHTPVEGLGARLTSNINRNVYATGVTATGIHTHSHVDTYLNITPSVIYERGPLTLTTEAQYTQFDNDIRFTTASGAQVAPEVVVPNRNCGGYVSGSWHFAADIDTTASIERVWDDLSELDHPNTTRYILAARWGITEHWSIKGEYQHIVGPGQCLAVDNPGGIEDHWDLFALKTTVDF